MKKILIAFGTFYFFLSCVCAQNIGIGTSTPSASAILDVKSSNKGVLLPRTSTTSRNAIANPAKGLLLYDSTMAGFWFHNGSAWTQLSAAGNGWSLTGNAGTNPAANFIGTTDNQPLNFKANNILAGKIDPENSNAFFGSAAGQANNTGQANTAIGDHSLAVNTDGNFNTANGYYSLSANTSGYNNTANGSYALSSNVQGYSNTATGRNSLFANTIGASNTATGTDALLSNNTGSFNSANGFQTLYTNTGGSFNTSSGSQSLYSNSNGSFNSAYGYSALYRNITGIYNTAMGMNALNFNTDGGYNTANGYNALYNNTGNFNTASGYNTLYNNGQGRDNAAIGNAALYSNFAGNYNTAIGTSALTSNSNGSDNTAVGHLALSSNTNGSNNTAVGYAADVSTLVTNATAIGSGAIVNASNKVRIGNSSVTVIEGQVAYSFPSDARFKYNIKNNVPGLDFITRLTPVTYYFDEQKLDEYTKTGIINKSINITPAYENKQLHSGFLAQDVEKIAEELGYEFDGIHIPADNKDHYSLSYSQFIMPLVKAIQEQQVIIKGLSKQVEQREIPAVARRQKVIIDKQQSEIDDLKILLGQMKIEIELIKNKK